MPSEEMTRSASEFSINQIFRWIRRNPAGIILLFLFLGALFSGILPQALKVNRAGLEVLRALTEKDTVALKQFSSQLSASAELDCRILWLSAVSAAGSQGTLASHEVLLKAIRCQPEYLAVLRGLAPFDIRLAEEIVRMYPYDASALMWLAEMKERYNRAQAAELYEMVTRVDPNHGLAWCRLGAFLQNQGDLDRALAAFQECCLHGDPGSNGCWRSGGILEKQGRLEEAIFWYNQSRFSESLKRARMLQEQISASGQD